MKTNKLSIAIVTFAILIFAADWTVAHGTRHAGGHPDDSDCLKPIKKKGLIGLGYWENRCSYGVHVMWRLENKNRPCRFVSYRNPYPCMLYVGAKARATAHMSDDFGRGSVFWIACKAKDFASGPVPRITKVNADKSVRFGCYHHFYGPNGIADKKAFKQQVEKAVQVNWQSINQTYQNIVLARLEQERARKRAEREEWLAEQEEARRLKELADRLEEEEEREWERRRRQRNRAEMNQWQNIMDMINQGAADAYLESLRQNQRHRNTSPSSGNPYSGGELRCGGRYVAPGADC